MADDDWRTDRIGSALRAMNDEQFDLGPRHDPLREAIGSELDRLRSAD